MEPATEATTLAFPRGPQAWTHYAEILLGLWLIISAYCWPHPVPTRTNTWVFGLIIVVAGLSTVGTPSARWTDRVAAVLLVILTLPMARFSIGTAANNIIVAIAVILLSLVSERGYPLRVRV